MKAILIEDDRQMLEGLKAMIQIYCPDLEVIGEALNVEDGNDLLNRTLPDLLFLDVELQDKTAFDLLQNLEKIDFQVIFVTAHDHYAIQAIRFSATDYLLKPVDPLDLCKAVARARKRDQQKQQELSLQNLLEQSRNPQSLPDTIVLRDLENIYLVQISNIIRLEADGRYTHFYLSEQPGKILVSGNLKDYEQMLESHQFVRCHHSHLVQRSWISKMSKSDLVLFLRNGEQIPVSERKKKTLLESF